MEFLEGTREEGGLWVSWRVWPLSAAGIGREWAREDLCARGQRRGTAQLRLEPKACWTHPRL